MLWSLLRFIFCIKPLYSYVSGSNIQNNSRNIMLSKYKATVSAYNSMDEVNIIILYTMITMMIVIPEIRLNEIQKLSK